MKTSYTQIISGEGKKAEAFHIQTDKGMVHGMFCDNRIWVHGIIAPNGIKGIMQVLVNRYKTSSVTFTPLINDNIKEKVRGEIKICKADSPDNPYKEDFEYLECEWARE